MSKTFKLAALTLAALSASGAFAQAKDDGQWRGLASASLSTTSGNSSTSAVLLNVDVASQTKADKTTLGAYTNYGSSKAAGVTNTTNNKWGLLGQYDYNISPQMFVFGKLGLEADKVTDLSLRRTLGGGVGYKVINDNTTTFDVFGGLANINDKFKNTKTIGSNTGTSFSSTSVLLGEESTHKISDAVFFKQRAEIYPSISGAGGTVGKFTANLGVTLSKSMQMTVGLVDNYNAKVSAGQKKNDLALFTGVSVKLGN